MARSADFLQGTLDLLVLRTLASGPLHGWGVAKRIEATSGNVLQVTQGALYPALHRLEQQGWIKSQWRPTPTGRDAKFYALTRAGQGQLEAELEHWRRLSGAVGLVLKLA